MLEGFIGFVFGFGVYHWFFANSVAGEAIAASKKIPEVEIDFKKPVVKKRKKINHH